MKGQQSAYVRQLNAFARDVHLACVAALDDDGDWRAWLEHVRRTALGFMNDTAEDNGRTVELVANFYTTEHGACHSCPSPALYSAGSDWRLCPPCAAEQAAQGAAIYRL